MDPRNETLREQIATIIQTGHINLRTSDEIAGDVIAAVAAWWSGANRK